jgi:predicted esterase
MSLTSVVIAAKSKHTATVLWLHGLGDTGTGWSFLGEELSGLLPHVKWIFPNAYVVVLKVYSYVIITKVCLLIDPLSQSLGTAA